MEAKTAQQLELERWVLEGSQLPCVQQRAQEVGVSRALLCGWGYDQTYPILSCLCCMESVDVC